MSVDKVDGYGVLHDRSRLQDDGPTEYIFGPLPSKELADVIAAQSQCGCAVRVVPLFFPPGLTMMFTIPVDESAPMMADNKVH